jgi:hypothetical protein
MCKVVQTGRRPRSTYRRSLPVREDRARGRAQQDQDRQQRAGGGALGQHVHRAAHPEGLEPDDVLEGPEADAPRLA